MKEVSNLPSSKTSSPSPRLYPVFLPFPSTRPISAHRPQPTFHSRFCLTLHITAAEIPSSKLQQPPFPTPLNPASFTTTPPSPLSKTQTQLNQPFRSLLDMNYHQKPPFSRRISTHPLAIPFNYPFHKPLSSGPTNHGLPYFFHLLSERPVLQNFEFSFSSRLLIIRSTTFRRGKLLSIN